MSRTWTTGIVRIEFPPSRAHARTSSETCLRRRLFARIGTIAPGSGCQSLSNR